jgi:hypothetical protein
MLPSTKIFVGISLIVTGLILGFAVPFWMPRIISGGELGELRLLGKTTDIAEGVGGTDEHGAMVDGMLAQMHYLNVAYLVALFLCLAGTVVLLFGLHGTARLIERIYYQTKPAEPPFSNS